MFMALATPWRRTLPIAAATQAYNKFVVLLADGQFADSMLVAIATPWRLTPPIDMATQAARWTNWRRR
ncbi:hypothetical protein PF011_g11670 [Phytophthora fragariae]|uniref:Uncharacterized protein n=1 Tax=Phytophthora fragariae TaxID=53985 RepID=A0A6A3KFV7_9STRA|nr:hypothetical protein PF011_g11670 [Phytophthora fragariae]